LITIKMGSVIIGKQNIPREKVMSIRVAAEKTSVQPVARET